MTESGILVSEFDVGITVHNEPTGGIVDTWYVDLPAQHDDSHTVAWGYSKEETVAKLEQFIVDAQVALETLKATEACQHDWQDDNAETIHNGGTARRMKCAKCEGIIWQVVDRSTAQPWYAEQYYGIKIEKQSKPATTNLTALPLKVIPGASGHEHDHAVLKVEYDSRHPEAPLPELGGGVATHEAIHILLAGDFNQISDGNLLPTELGGLTPGHIEAHNILHVGANERIANANS